MALEREHDEAYLRELAQQGERIALPYPETHVYAAWLIQRHGPFIGRARRGLSDLVAAHQSQGIVPVKDFDPSSALESMGLELNAMTETYRALRHNDQTAVRTRAREARFVIPEGTNGKRNLPLQPGEFSIQGEALKPLVDATKDVAIRAASALAYASFYTGDEQPEPVRRAATALYELPDRMQAVLNDRLLISEMIMQPNLPKPIHSRRTPDMLTFRVVSPYKVDLIGKR